MAIVNIVFKGNYFSLFVKKKIFVFKNAHNGKQWIYHREFHILYQSFILKKTLESKSSKKPSAATPSRKSRGKYCLQPKGGLVYETSRAAPKHIQISLKKQLLKKKKIKRKKFKSQQLYIKKGKIPKGCPRSLALCLEEEEADKKT